MLTFKVIDNFFDRDDVIAQMDEAEHRALSKAGAFIRRRAQRSMRRRKGPAPPGSPPSKRSGELHDYLFFAWDASTRSVVVGPVGFKHSAVPALHEFGGTTTNRYQRTITVRSAGQGPRGRKTERVVLRAGEKLTYPARPTMGPALEAERSKLPELFRNAVRVEV